MAADRCRASAVWPSTKSKARMACADPETSSADYRLEEQVGFVLRQVTQRHTTLFAARMIEGLTPTQWAVLAKLAERGPLSQNRLGCETAMDAATIKGVVDRLAVRDLVVTRPDSADARRLAVEL